MTLNKQMAVTLPENSRAFEQFILVEASSGKPWQQAEHGGKGFQVVIFLHVTLYGWVERRVFIESFGLGILSDLFLWMCCKGKSPQLAFSFLICT